MQQIVVCRATHSHADGGIRKAFGFGTARALHRGMHSTIASEIVRLDSRLGRSTLEGVRADVAYEICPGVWMRASDGTFLGDGGTVPISLRLRATIGASLNYAAA